MVSSQFRNYKKLTLSKADKSDKGSLDKEIASLVRKINSQHDYYTTSSCSGRIILIKSSDKKEEGLFLYRTHSRISLKELKKALRNSIERHKGAIYFMQEPCILHVAASGIDKAKELMNKARHAGWKRSGIIALRDKAVCELKSTEHLSLPIAKGRILVSDNYLRILVKDANKKLKRTTDKIRKLEMLV